MRRAYCLIVLYASGARAPEAAGHRPADDIRPPGPWHYTDLKPYRRDRSICHQLRARLIRGMPRVTRAEAIRTVQQGLEEGAGCSGRGDGFSAAGATRPSRAALVLAPALPPSAPTDTVSPDTASETMPPARGPHFTNWSRPIFRLVQATEAQVSARIQHRLSEGNDGVRSARVRFQAWFGRTPRRHRGPRGCSLGRVLRRRYIGGMFCADLQEIPSSRYPPVRAAGRGRAARGPDDRGMRETRAGRGRCRCWFSRSAGVLRRACGRPVRLRPARGRASWAADLAVACLTCRPHGRDGCLSPLSSPSSGCIAGARRARPPFY